MRVRGIVAFPGGWPKSPRSFWYVRGDFGHFFKPEKAHAVNYQLIQEFSHFKLWLNTITKQFFGLD